MSITQLPVANSDTLNKQLQLAGSVPESKEYKQALKFLKQPALLDAMETALHDKQLTELAIKHPMKLLLKYGIGLPEGFEIEFSLTPQKFKPINEPWFELRKSNCRRYYVKDDKKDPTTWHWEEVCLAIRVTRKIPGPRM
jgi:hypothetical protein